MSSHCGTKLVVTRVAALSLCLEVYQEREMSEILCLNTRGEIGNALELLYRSAAASHFGRPGKSAAAAAITLSTQGVNEHQIESLQQTNYSWCILRCFMIYSWVNILPFS